MKVVNLNFKASFEHVSLKLCKYVVAFTPLSTNILASDFVKYDFLADWLPSFPRTIVQLDEVWIALPLLVYSRRKEQRPDVEAKCFYRIHFAIFLNPRSQKRGKSSNIIWEFPKCLFSHLCIFRSFQLGLIKIEIVMLMINIV